MGTGSFPGVKRPGRGADQPLPSSAEVNERVLPLWAIVACSIVKFTLILQTEGNCNIKHIQYMFVGDELF